MAALSIAGVAALASTSSTPSGPSDPWRLPASRTTAALRVVRCPVSLGAPNPTTVHLPRTVTARVADGAAGLVAFTDGAGALVVVAPATWGCAAVDAVDGSATLSVFPPGIARPSWGGVAAIPEGIVAIETGRCLGCSLETACPLFADAARAYERAYGVKCHAPAGERERRLSPWRVLSYDPPGVRGEGGPSGGADAAYGAMLWHVPRTHALTAWQETCALPDSMRALCVAAVEQFAVLGRS
jgi:hypothetical protein